MVGICILCVILLMYIVGLLPALFLGRILNFDEGPSQTFLSWLWIPWFIFYKLEVLRKIKNMISKIYNIIKNNRKLILKYFSYIIILAVLYYGIIG